VKSIRFAILLSVVCTVCICDRVVLLMTMNVKEITNAHDD